MLVLSRRRNESIILNDNIEVRILDITRHHVKIGIQAPRSVPVYRKEIYDQIARANEAAAVSSDTNVTGIGKLFEK